MSYQHFSRNEYIEPIRSTKVRTVVVTISVTEKTVTRVSMSSKMRRMRNICAIRDSMLSRSWMVMRSVRMGHTSMSRSIPRSKARIIYSLSGAGELSIVCIRMSVITRLTASSRSDLIGSLILSSTANIPAKNTKYLFLG